MFREASPEYLDQDDDPAWRVIFTPSGARRVLARRGDGDCTFLGTAGCTLPLEVRPLVCRLYPYDYTALGLRDELSEGCPTELLGPAETLISALEMDVEVAEAWRAQLYRELALESVDEDRPDLRPEE